MDRFCKTCLGLIVLLLFVIALRPLLVAQSVVAQSKKLEPANASTRVWQYGYTCMDGMVTEANMTKGIGEVNSLAAEGWEVITALPVAGFRNDNIAMGTVNVCYILRHPK
jgi:hypothetical protein